MEWLSQVNRVLAILWIPCLLILVVLLMQPKEKLSWRGIEAESKELPGRAFEQSPEDYAAIGEPLLNLNFNPPQLQLPDLRPFLVYYGRNGRPDSALDAQSVYFGLKNIGRVKEFGVLKAGGRLYLTYESEENRRRGRYLFTPDNEASSLWIEAESDGESTTVTVSMQGQDGKLLQEPEANRSFALQEQELPRTTGQRWELDGLRVDSSLLVRQRARWYGSDAFLEKHGGEEFETVAAKQRIRFGEADKIYYVFIGEGEGLAWNEGRWQRAELGEFSRGKPLLFLRKADERILRFDLWDAEGRAKTAVNLVRTNEMWRFPGKHKFKFIGARTRSQWVLELNGQRLIVGPSEWLLFDEEVGGWRILSTAEEIDAYASGELGGELFVTNVVEKKDGQLVLTAHVFSSSRTQLKMVELSSGDGEMIVFDEGEEPQEREVRRSPVERQVPDRGELNSVEELEAEIGEQEQRDAALIPEESLDQIEQAKRRALESFTGIKRR